MEPNSKNFKELVTLQLGECVTSLALCPQYLAAGCLDDSLSIWNADFAGFKKQPFFYRNNNSMGIVDIKFNKKLTYLAASCMDSTIRLWDTATEECSIIECEVMENWKIEFLENTILTCGDLGRVNFYDSTSKERLNKLDLGDVFLTSMTKSNDAAFLAVGNNSGDVHIVNLQRKNKVATFKPHFKITRAVAFVEDSTKLLTSSDDATIKLIDVPSEKIIACLEGHKQAVSSVCTHSVDSKIAYSCSFDKTVKLWDLRLKTSVGTAVTGSPLWDCKSIGSNVVAGGESGMLSVYTVC